MKSNESRSLRLFFGCLFASLFIGLYAQKMGMHIIQKQSTKFADSIKSPIIKLTGDVKKTEKNPSLKILKIDVKVIGNMATTTMDMTFYNDNNRVLEGELIFPLGEGQSVSRLALEVNGVLREAVVVDKNLGQKVYEQLLRKNVDPGLVEWVQGNTYRARVYPLPAKGTKRLVVAFEQELKQNQDGRLAYYQPMNYAQIIDEFDVHVEVLKQIAANGENGVALNFKSEEDKMTGEIHHEFYLANTPLTFTIAIPANQKVFTELVEGKNYFYAPVSIEPQTRAKKLPTSVVLFWDVSGSAMGRNIDNEIRLLRSYLSRFNALPLKVITFAHQVISEKDFNISANYLSELESYLRTLEYDGATNLAALNFEQFTSGEILLFTDGLSNYGNNKMNGSKVPITTISSSAQANYEQLKYLAETTGGQLINLSTTEVQPALDMLLNEPLRIIDVSFNQDKSFDAPQEIFPVSGSIVQDQFSVAGISASNPFELAVSYGFGNEKTGEKVIKINPLQAGFYQGMVKRIWAQKKINHLLLQAEKNKQQIVDCAVSNHIVTPFTSLLVLDRLEDYIQYKITPPEELIASYDSAMKVKQVEELKSKTEQIEKVVEMFKERKAWWETDFTIHHNEPIPSKNDSAIDMSNNGYISTATDSVSATHQWHFGNTSNSYTVDATVAAGELDEDGISDVKDEEKSSNLGVDLNAKKAKAELAVWEPNMPYLEELKKVGSDVLFSTYLKLKEKYGKSPSFYLDVADYFTKQNKPEEALRIVSNLVEIEIKNYRLMRVLAHRLEQLGKNAEAVELFKQVLELRQEEPQSYRDLGLALAKNNQPQEAIEMLYGLVQTNWDGRFPEIEVIVLGELNNIIATSTSPLKTDFIDNRLIKHLPFDARVILNWDTDNCDIDLWVTDPKGEKCFYSNRNTKIGGRNSRDFTGGYGPEEFIIKNAMKGKYKVEINYYGTREQTILGPTTIQVEMYTNYGKKSVGLDAVTRRLQEKKEELTIGSFVIE